MSAADVSSAGHGAGRPCYARVMEAGGQDFLAAVVSLPGGRWANKLIGADAAMLAAAGLRSLPEQNIVQPGAQLLGFAVLQGWRLL